MIKLSSIPVDQTDEDTKQSLLSDPDCIVWDFRDPDYEKKLLFWREEPNNPQRFIQKYGHAPDIVYQELGLAIPNIY
jgi:hypothetical protein